MSFPLPVLTHADFVLLDAIDRQRPRSQRTLARYSGMSPGKTNHMLRKLVNLGLVEIEGTAAEARRGRCVYLLTPGGAEARARMTLSFIKARMRQFEELRDRLLENLILLQARGSRRLLLLGSEALGKLLAHIAHTQDLDVQFVATTSTVEGCRDLPQEGYDALLITEDSHDPAQLLRSLEIPSGGLKGRRRSAAGG